MKYITTLLILTTLLSGCGANEPANKVDSKEIQQSEAINNSSEEAQSVEGDDQLSEGNVFSVYRQTDYMIVPEMNLAERNIPITNAGLDNLSFIGEASDQSFTYLVFNAESQLNEDQYLTDFIDFKAISTGSDAAEVLPHYSYTDYETKKHYFILRTGSKLARLDYKVINNEDSSTEESYNKISLPAEGVGLIPFNGVEPFPTIFGYLPDPITISTSEVEMQISYFGTLTDINGYIDRVSFEYSLKSQSDAEATVEFNWKNKQENSSRFELFEAIEKKENYVLGIPEHTSIYQRIVTVTLTHGSETRTVDVDLLTGTVI